MTITIVILGIALAASLIAIANAIEYYFTPPAKASTKSTERVRTIADALNTNDSICVSNEQLRISFCSAGSAVKVWVSAETTNSIPKTNTMELQPRQLPTLSPLIQSPTNIRTKLRNQARMFAVRRG